MDLIVRAVEELEWLAVGGRELPGGRAVLRLAGELDATTCGLLRDALEAQLRAGRPRLVVDMAELEFIDSSGLSVLAEFAVKAARSGGQLALAAPQPHPA